MLFNIHFQKWSKVTVEENEAYETSSIWNIKFIRRENSQCLSPLFVFYFLSNYDGLRTKLPCLIDNLCDSYSKKLEIIKRGQNYSIYQVSCFINKSLHVASCSTSSSRQGFWHGKLRFKKSHWSKTPPIYYPSPLGLPKIQRRPRRPLDHLQYPKCIQKHSRLSQQ